MTGRFAGHDPAEGADTAGVPWAGRTLAPTGFEGDTGTADAALARALRAPEDEVALVAAVAAARLVVPVVAVPGEVTEVDGLVADAGSDMAAVTLTAPDGTRALPAFTDVGALGEWDSAARPVPVTAARAAQAAVQEGCQVIVLDPPPPGTSRDAVPRPTVVLRGSMLWALATERQWVPAHLDDQVSAAVGRAVACEPVVTGHGLSGTADGALQVRLELPTGVPQAELSAVVTRVAEQLATDGEVRARIDAVSFTIVPGPTGGGPAD